MRPTCGCSFFIFPTGTVCEIEIELSHKGINNGNPDLVCAKLLAIIMLCHEYILFSICLQIHTNNWNHVCSVLQIILTTISTSTGANET